MNGNGPQGTHDGGGYHGTDRVAVVFVKANHGGIWQDLTWQNISGVNVVGGISMTEDHSNAHGDPPWPLPLPLPLGAGPAPSGPSVGRKRASAGCLLSCCWPHTHSLTH
eukprot:SAG22_NODE_1452_length_4395_cov_2.925745_5_plen_109_part_00